MIALSVRQPHAEQIMRGDKTVEYRTFRTNKRLSVSSHGSNRVKHRKPRRVKARITRTVEEIAIVLLDRDGSVEEVEEIHEELDYEVIELCDIQAVLTVQ